MKIISKAVKETCVHSYVTFIEGKGISHHILVFMCWSGLMIASSLAIAHGGMKYEIGGSVGVAILSSIAILVIAGGIIKAWDNYHNKSHIDINNVENSQTQPLNSSDRIIDNNINNKDHININNVEDSQTQSLNSSDRIMDNDIIDNDINSIHSENIKKIIQTINNQKCLTLKIYNFFITLAQEKCRLIDKDYWDNIDKAIDIIDMNKLLTHENVLKLLKIPEPIKHLGAVCMDIKEQAYNTLDKKIKKENAYDINDYINLPLTQDEFDKIIQEHSAIQQAIEFNR